jgi:double-stranded uracil-DNA glycosylase
MNILPDYLEPGLRAVLVGTAGCDGPGERRHYYAGPGNNFWLLLHESGLTPNRLGPEDDETLPSYGVGLTDLIWTRTPGPDGRPIDSYDIPDFIAKIDKYRPAVVAFTSKTAAAAYARAARERPPRDFGPVTWTIGDRPGFVLPGPSGANNGMPLALRVALWRDLVDFIETL